MDPARRLRILAVLSCCCCWISFCCGSIHRYQLSPFKPWDNGYTFFGGSEGLYASGKSPSHINFNVQFRRTVESAARHETMEHSTGLVEALLFTLEDRDFIGVTNSTGERMLCCTPEASKLSNCRIGEVILRKRENGWPKTFQTSFQGNKLVNSFSEDVNVTETGLYTLYFVFCEPQLQGLQIRGRTIWQSPTGFLPGRMAPLLKFYGYMSLAYLVLGVIWFIQYARFWRDILQLQNCISVVIFLGHAEMALWYFDYANFNATGRRPMGITAWAVTIGAMRKTVSRLLVLIVSMGYGVVKPTLGGITSKVLLCGGAYFVAIETLELAENVQRVDDFSNKEKLLLVLPVAIIDALFILWIFSSLSKTLESLQAKKQTAKLELYKRFTNFLALAVIASIVWIGYEFYLKSTEAYNIQWQNAWVVLAFWIVLSYVMLCVICYLWKPSQNSTRYAYSEELGEDCDPEEAIQLTSNMDSSNGRLNGSVEKKNTEIDVFTLGTIGEEDKRD
ncbi:transmembrane protein 87B [Selaginella moellendorffii]|nr:transmembrane protein 87B [Selaginella moellendorffii]|eukprot:XP_002971001.2 transmembrane protein 87B [Selaginella moellendorffii]